MTTLNTTHLRYTRLDRSPHTRTRATRDGDIPAIPMKVLRAMQLCMDEAGTRPGLHGIYFEVTEDRTVFLSATNGHHLSVIELDGEAAGMADLGSEGTQGLICGKSVLAHVKDKGNTGLVLSDEEYPDVLTVVPDLLDKLDCGRRAHLLRCSR